MLRIVLYFKDSSNGFRRLRRRRQAHQNLSGFTASRTISSFSLAAIQV